MRAGKINSVTDNFKKTFYELAKEEMQRLIGIYLKLIEKTKEFMEMAKDKIVLPEDSLVTTNFDFNEMKLNNKLESVDISNIPIDGEALDIGEKSIATFKEILKNAKTVVWNGPMGVFECTETAKGTFEIAKLLSDITLTGTTTIIGGGDSASAMHSPS